MSDNLHARIGVSSVKALKPGQVLRDVEVKGFGARRQKGAVSYFLQTRVNGRLTWLTIGRHGSPWTPETARKEAMRLLVQIAGGINPAAARRRTREIPTLVDAAYRFLDEHGPMLKPQTRRDYECQFRNHILPALGARNVDEVDRADVARFHARMHATSRTANLCVAILSKLMSWCEMQGFRPEGENPCRRLSKFRERKRERFLTSEELARLGETLDRIERQGTQSFSTVAAIRLLLFTGARLSEILTLKWSYIDLERRLILLPDSKTGAKPIPLSVPAVEVLDKLPRLAGNPHVIPGSKAGAPLVNLQKPWRAIRAEAGLEGVRLHDLRHSFASVAVARGGSLPVIGKMLGHSNPQTTQRYAHLGNDPVARLAEETARQISEALTGSKVTAGRLAPDE